MCPPEILKKITFTDATTIQTQTIFDRMSDPVPHRSVNLVVCETPCAVLWLLIVAPGPPNDDAPFKLTDGKSEQAIKKRGSGGRPSVCLKGNPEDPASGWRPALFLFFLPQKQTASLFSCTSYCRKCLYVMRPPQPKNMQAAGVLRGAEPKQCFLVCLRICVARDALGIEPRNPACRIAHG